MGLHTDHKGMFLADWFIEQMRYDMREALGAENPHDPWCDTILEDIDQKWPRPYVLTPPVIPQHTGGRE